MSRASARCLHVATLLVGGTGFVYGWMRYFAEPLDEFSVVGHPWQPATQHGHVVIAPLLVFACGWIWLDHVWKRVRSGFVARRRTGLVLFALFVPMVLSGYLLQVSSDEALRNAWVWVHGLTSVFWTVTYLIHQFSPRSVSRSAATPAA